VTSLCNIVTEELGQPCGWSSFSLGRPGVLPGAGCVEQSYDPADTQIGNLGRTRYHGVEAGPIDLDLRCPAVEDRRCCHAADGNARDAATTRPVIEGGRRSALIKGYSRDDGRV
jgi:hypothetical protein